MVAVGDTVPASLLTYVETLTGAWTDWSPTLTNLTVGGGGSVTARYRELGKTLDFRFKFVFGAGSAVGTDPQFTLPATAHAGYAFLEDTMGRAVLYDNGTAVRSGELRFVPGATVVIMQVTAATGNHTSVTATSPWTWATGDSLAAYGTIELA